jgi:hypothetical protein
VSILTKIDFMAGFDKWSLEYIGWVEPSLGNRLWTAYLLIYDDEEMFRDTSFPTYHALYFLDKRARQDIEAEFQKDVDGMASL